MKILDDVLRLVSDFFRKTTDQLKQNWGRAGSSWWFYLVLWASLVVVSVVNVYDVVLKWGLLGDVVGAPEGFWEAFFLYPIGGRLLAGLVFIAILVLVARKSRAWLLALGTLYFATRFLDIDGFIIDFLDSRDTLLLVGRTDLGEGWSLTVAVLNFVVAALLVGALISAFANTRVFQDYRQGVRADLSRLRISEIILWISLLSQVSLFIVAWVYLWLGTNAFAVMLTYPVIGRLLVVVVFGALLAVSVRSRGLLLTLGVAAYLVQLLGVDGMVLAAFGQQDRFFGTLFSDANLAVVGELFGLTFILLPIILIWIAVISIASVVRKRARDRLNTWIDSRRESIYGVEDSDSEKPTRVSLLAVFALITSIVFPLLGLVLAYAARNDFVAARPRKAGVDLAVAATIIGWFGLGVQLLFVIVTFAGGLLQGPSPTDLFFGLFQSVFGFGAFTGGADLLGNLIDVLDS